MKGTLSGTLLSSSSASTPSFHSDFFSHRDVRHITYRQLHNEVCRLANALKRVGVRKGDAVCIYMPMVPEAAYAMLACTRQPPSFLFLLLFNILVGARIGAVHSVVFGGFSSEALSSRIDDAQCKVDYSLSLSFPFLISSPLGCNYLR